MGVVSMPLRGLMYIFEEIAEQAENELYNEDEVRGELVNLHRSLEAGNITEEAFEARELELLERLAEIEERNRKKGAPRGSSKAKTRS